MGTPEREKGMEDIFETTMTENFPKLMSDQDRSTDPGSSENTNRNKFQKNYTWACNFQTTENQR